MYKYIGLDVLAFEIISLISKGYSESIFKIEEELDKSNLVDYLNTKYRKDFMANFEDGTYDLQELNKYFSDYSGYIQGNESRKFGVYNANEGLLLVIALIINGLKLPIKE